LLHRAESHLGFSYEYPTDDAPQPKKPDDFVRDHGSVVEEIRYNFLDASYFEEATNTLHLSEIRSPSSIEPERSEKVEAWMRAYGHGDEQKFRHWCVWMSQFCDTSRALAGLVLLGPSGIGKSAFAAGMSKMFGTNPACSMRNYLSNFNSEVLANPLIFADESIPQVNGRIPSDALRTLISASSHEINRKNRSIVTLDGFARVIMSLQTLSKFDLGGGHPGRTLRQSKEDSW
jgi:hypothetical protein